MVKLNKRLIKFIPYTILVSILLFTGHLIAQSYSTNYSAHLEKVSSLISDYIYNLADSTIKVDGLEIDLSFKGAPPVSGMAKPDIVKWNKELFQHFIDEPVFEPKVDNLVRSPADASQYERANATLVVLVRNKELLSVISTISQIEAKFNHKFHYPYVFLNDNSFSAKFKNRIQELLPDRELYFETIEPETWNRPISIDRDREKLGRQYLVEENIAYAGKTSYRNMCRYYSGNFYNHPRLQQFRWYWRFEPGTNYFCNIDYDVFKFMEDNGKTYGFTIALYDSHQSVKSLWTTTLQFLKRHPQYLNRNGAFNFLTENLIHPEKSELTQGYSTCHFWSNFEIGDMDFFRLELYSNWFKFLDESGGFYYERWGDAPVHSIGLSLFEDKSKLHWFRDIGYEHPPYTNCPNSRKCDTIVPGQRKNKSKKQCEVGGFTFPHNDDQNCMANWIRYEMDDEAINVY